MGLEQTILIISDKADIERDSVADAWQARGGEVLRLGRFWDPPDLSGKDVRVYGADTFCLVLAQKLGLELISPDDELIFDVPPALLGRTIARHPLSDAEAFPYPCFIKPLTPKQFRAAVYTEYEELLAETRDLDISERVLLSEVVHINAEARFFVLDGEVKSGAVYEGEGDLAAARSAAERLCEQTNLPRTVVVDMGLLDSGRWVVVEFNATWGSGLNGCDPDCVVDCIDASLG